MARMRTLAALLAVGGAALVAARHARKAAKSHAGTGHGEHHGGTLIKGVGFYDTMTGVLSGGLFRRVAADVATCAAAAQDGPRDARVLEVGCGPGRLAMLLAWEHGLEVVAVDLDPAMVQRASIRAARVRGREGSANLPAPTFGVADAADLPFPEGHFDVVVSTFSVHHWANPASGLAEAARVLRPGGRALIWDFAPGRGPSAWTRHADLDIAALAEDVPLRLVDASPWRWPGPLSWCLRWELVRAMPEVGTRDPAMRDGGTQA